MSADKDSPDTPGIRYVGYVGEAQELPYAWDPKITALKALKFGAIGAAGLFLGDVAGITQYLIHFVPPQYAGVAPVVIGMAIEAVRNWLKNRD